MFFICNLKFFLSNSRHEQIVFSLEPEFHLVNSGSFYTWKSRSIQREALKSSFCEWLLPSSDREYPCIINWSWNPKVKTSICCHGGKRVCLSLLQYPLNRLAHHLLSCRHIASGAVLGDVDCNSLWCSNSVEQLCSNVHRSTTMKRHVNSLHAHVHIHAHASAHPC